MGRYKFGRSTMNEQGMVKLKRFEDDEALVVGLVELMHNDNPLGVNELGYAHRTSHQANKVPTGRLGALQVQWQGKVFNIGTGFDDALRHEIWNSPDKFLGRAVKFKYLSVGMKHLPRHPVFLGWRNKEDL
jgi:DNA ligase-1